MEPQQARELRAAMVQALIETGAIRTQPVADAFLAVPREQFLPRLVAAEGIEVAYRDAALVTKRDAQGRPASSSSQPTIMAIMLELLAPAAGQHILEVGLGTGYNAALLSELVGTGGEVTGVDIDAEVTAAAAAMLVASGYGVRAITGDGRRGCPAHAPYDRIIATAAADALPRAWLEQLSQGGRLVTPLQISPDPEAPQLIPALVRDGQRLRSVDYTWGGFMPLHGGDGAGWESAGASVLEPRAPERVLEVLEDSDSRAFTRLEVSVSAVASTGTDALELRFDWTER